MRLTVSNKRRGGSSQGTIPQASDPLLPHTLAEQLQAGLSALGLLGSLERVDGSEDHSECSSCHRPSYSLDEHGPSERFEECKDTRIGCGITEARERPLEAVRVRGARSNENVNSHGGSESSVESLEPSISPQMLDARSEASSVSILVVHHRSERHQSQDLDHHGGSTGETTAASRLECSDKVKVEFV